MRPRSRQKGLSLFGSFLVRFPSAHDAVDLIETFDSARHRSCGRAVLVMCLKQCWATLSTAAIAGELRFRKPPASDRHDRFTLTFQHLSQFSRSDGPGAEKGGSGTASSIAGSDAGDSLCTPKQHASFCSTQRSRCPFQPCSSVTAVRAGASSSSLNKRKPHLFRVGPRNELCKSVHPSVAF